MTTDSSSRDEAPVAPPEPLPAEGAGPESEAELQGVLERLDEEDAALNEGAGPTDSPGAADSTQTDEATAPDEETADDESAAEMGSEDGSAEDEPISGQNEMVAAGFDADTDRQGTGVPVWPFLLYMAAWLAFGGSLVWYLRSLPRTLAGFESLLYEPALYAGIALVALGPVVSLTTWLVIRVRGTARSGAFAVSLMYGALATLGGVVVWWAALMAADYLRLGRIF